MCHGGGGKGLKGPWGLGRWMCCWQKERKVSPQADSLESLMMPWLICIGHPAELLCFYICHVWWDRKVKLHYDGCGLAAGIQLKRLLSLSQTSSMQHINKFFTKYLQHLSTPSHQYEDKTESCFPFDRNSPRS